eukprot:10461450-Alexandrium_andersonii.AAC.1
MAEPLAGNLPTCSQSVSPLLLFSETFGLRAAPELAAAQEGVATPELHIAGARAKSVDLCCVAAPCAAAAVAFVAASPRP